MSELPPVDKDLDTEGFCKIGWYNNHLSLTPCIFLDYYYLSHLHLSPSFLPSPSPFPSPPLSSLSFIAEVQYYYKDQVKWKIIETTGVQGFNVPLPLILLPRPPSPSPGTQVFHSILVCPSHPQATPPLIVWPHRGPHSGYIAGFILWSECLAVLGFSVLLGEMTAYVQYNVYINYVQYMYWDSVYY